MANQVRPGICPPEGCPPPTEIDCIIVDKVYDSCYQSDERTRTTTVTTGTGGQFATGTFAVGDVVGCGLTAGDTISCTLVSSVPAGDNFATITVLVTVPVTLTNPNAATETVDTIFTFTKTATLCFPAGVSISCSESTLLSCSCVVTAVGTDTIEVTCDLIVCLVLKTFLTVQLLVPTYGFCVPAPCTTIGVCPPIPPAQCF